MFHGGELADKIHFMRTCRVCKDGTGSLQWLCSSLLICEGGLAGQGEGRGGKGGRGCCGLEGAFVLWKASWQE